MIGKSLMRGKESALRHKVRKLRAKVRALLLDSICTKFQKRNQDVENLQLNRNIHKSLHAGKDWNLSYYVDSDQYFFDQKQKTIHLFSKLKLKEIQQINEDKLYYLGDTQHIHLYNEFVFQNYPGESAGLAGLQYKPKEDCKKKRENTQSVEIKSNPPQDYHKSKKYQSNHQIISAQKQKHVEDSLKVRSAYHRMRLKDKFEKAQFLYEHQRKQNISTHKAKNKKYQSQREFVLRKRRNRQEKGFIAEMNLQLRQLLLRKTNK